MYTPVPLLILLALLAAAFGLVPSPHAQAVVHTLLVATLAASVLHLQARAGARVSLLALPAVLLVCATLCAFIPRFARVTPVLFLACIVTTLGPTFVLFRRASSTAPPPSPASSDTSFEKPRLSVPQRAPLALVLLLSAQLSYALATAFCIPPALHSPGPTPPLVVSLVSISRPSTPIVFRILDTAFTVLALLFVCTAYYHSARTRTRTRHTTPVLLKPPPPPSATSPSPSTPPSSATATPPPPAVPPPTPPPRLRLPPGTRVSKRAWSWHTPTPTPAPSPSPSEHEEGDFRDLRDPFAPVPASPGVGVGVGIGAPPSAYHRWAASAIEVGASGVGVGVPTTPGRRPRSSSYDACLPPPISTHTHTHTRTRMSAWGRLPVPLSLPLPLLPLPLSPLQTRTRTQTRRNPSPSPTPPRNPSPRSTSTSPRRPRLDSGARRFDSGARRAAASGRSAATATNNVRPRTPPPPPARDRDKDRERDGDEDGDEDVREDALVAQRLLVRLASAQAQAGV
ncbi:hypothetical protein C0992_004472 [Termitomyces sp. T32_za158]|nr:hypothetical protein C0992_004472 [Termitomyces sp. T32_za158]